MIHGAGAGKLYSWLRAIDLLALASLEPEVGASLYSWLRAIDLLALASPSAVLRNERSEIREDRGARTRR
jgi:hypothetical protein